MSNMSYCRFRNTLTDAEDCAEALEDAGWDPNNIESKDEQRAAWRFVELCRTVAENAHEREEEEE